MKYCRDDLQRRSRTVYHREAGASQDVRKRDDGRAQHGKRAKRIVADARQCNGDDGRVAQGEHDRRQDDCGGRTHADEHRAEDDVDDHDLAGLVAMRERLDPDNDTLQGAGFLHEGDLQEREESHTGDRHRCEQALERGEQAEDEISIEEEHRDGNGEYPAHRTGDVTAHLEADDHHDHDDNRYKRNQKIHYSFPPIQNERVVRRAAIEARLSPCTDQTARESSSF